MSLHVQMWFVRPPYHQTVLPSKMMEPGHLALCPLSGCYAKLDRRAFSMSISATRVRG